MKHVALLATAAFGLLIIAACAARQAALYTGKMETCYQFSSSCSEYVECRKQAAHAFGREYDAGCFAGDASHDE